MCVSMWAAAALSRVCLDACHRPDQTLAPPGFVTVASATSFTAPVARWVLSVRF